MRDALLDALREAADGRAMMIGFATRGKVFLLRTEISEIVPLQPAAQMKIYSQRDPAWADYVYATAEAPATLGNAGCYITCIAMIASLAGYKDTPPQVAEKLKAAGVLKDALISHPERIPEAYPDLCFHGTRDWRKIPADLQEVACWLDISPLILEVDFRPGGSPPPVDQHFVVGIQLVDDDKDIIIADPWDGQKVRLLERYSLSGWKLERAIYGARLIIPCQE